MHVLHGVVAIDIAMPPSSVCVMQAGPAAIVTDPCVLRYSVATEECVCNLTPVCVPRGGVGVAVTRPPLVRYYY